MIARFFGSRIRETDVFLAGYPKSGMAWMEFLLAHAIFEKRGGDRVTFRTIDRYITDISKKGPGDPLFLWSFGNRKPRIFFTHTSFDPRLLKGRVIYMLRDPRDVLVSYYHYHRRVNPNFKLSMHQFFSVDQYNGTNWGEHVTGWLLDRAELGKLHVVRYEELRANTADVLSRVLAFIGVSIAEKELMRAVTMSQFERMRTVEEKYPTGKAKGDPAERHVRKGKVGGWMEEMSPSEVVFVERKYGRFMHRLGYPLSCNL